MSMLLIQVWRRQKVLVILKCKAKRFIVKTQKELHVIKYFKYVLIVPFCSFLSRANAVIEKHEMSVFKGSRVFH